MVEGCLFGNKLNKFTLLVLKNKTKQTNKERNKRNPKD